MIMMMSVIHGVGYDVAARMMIGRSRSQAIIKHIGSEFVRIYGWWDDHFDD
jgi:hypothetical protein